MIRVDGTLLLAAGKSTRIAPASNGLPKPLLCIAGEPILGRNLRWLAASGVTHAWINLHFQAGVIRDRIGDGAEWGLSIQYSLEPEILGTAGAWGNLAGQWGKTTLVVYGDNLVRFDLGRMAAAHAGSGADLTVALFDPARHVNTGMAGGRAVLGVDGRIGRFLEGDALTPGMLGLVNAGVYLVERSVLQRLPVGFSDFGRDVLPALAAEGRLAGHVIEDDGYCLGMDTPESLAVAQGLIDAHRVVLT